MLDRTKIIGTIGYMGGLMSLPEPFAWSWGNMLVFTHEAICQPGERIKPARTGYSYHSAGRNDLVSQISGSQQGGDWLLMLDTDLEFDPDFAARLITMFERYKLDILTGLYAYKNHPEVAVVHMLNEETGRHEPISKWDESVDLFAVSSAGAGCLLVRKSVYERIVTELYEPPFQVIGAYGEDHSFFMRARKLGIKAYCAWRIQAAHLGYKAVEHKPDHSLAICNEYTVSGFGTTKGEMQYGNAS